MLNFLIKTVWYVRGVGAGDPRYFWNAAHQVDMGEDISLTWFDIGEPLLIHSQPNQKDAQAVLS